MAVRRTQRRQHTQRIARVSVECVGVFVAMNELMRWVCRFDCSKVLTHWPKELRSSCGCGGDKEEDTEGDLWAIDPPIRPPSPASSSSPASADPTLQMLPASTPVVLRPSTPMGVGGVGAAPVPPASAVA
jgi:hypothetical protein